MLVFIVDSVLLLFQNSLAASRTSFPDDTQLQSLLGEYWKWWINLPEGGNPTEDDRQTVKNNCVMHKSDSVVFLLNPFEQGNIGQECQIPANSSVFFPFYTSWCDSGLKKFNGSQSYEKILQCALDDDRGFVIMEAWWDKKKIVDIQVDNIDVKNLKVAKNNLPHENYYKEIRTSSFYDITVTNKTQYSNIYQHPDEFAISPKVYKAVSHGFIAFIPAIPAGNHELKYHTNLIHSTGIGEKGGWDFESEITYNLKVIE